MPGDIHSAQTGSVLTLQSRKRSGSKVTQEVSTKTFRLAQDCPEVRGRRGDCWDATARERICGGRGWCHDLPLALALSVGEAITR